MGEGAGSAVTADEEPCMSNDEAALSKQDQLWGSEMFQTPAGPKTNVESQNSQRVFLFSFLEIIIIIKKRRSTCQILSCEELD